MAESAKAQSYHIKPHKRLVFFIGLMTTFLLVSINIINLLGIHGVNTSVLKLNYISGIKSDALAIRNQIYRHFFLENLEAMDQQEATVKEYAGALQGKIDEFHRIANQTDRESLRSVSEQLEAYITIHSKSLSLSKSFLKEDAISHESKDGEPVFNQLLDTIKLLQTKYSIRSPHELNDKIATILLRSLIFGALMSLFFLVLFDRAIIKRIYQILGAIKDIKDGKLGDSLKLKIADEISLIADGISAMSVTLKQKETDIIKYQTGLEEMVEEKTRDIRAILSNIRQGIFAISDPEGTVSEEHSDYLEEMLQRKDINGSNVIDLCFRSSSLGQDALDQLKNTISVTIGEDELAFDANGGLLPREVEFLKGSRSTIFEIDWNPILVNGMIRKLLVVIRDVTELRQLKMEADKKNAEFALLAEVVNIPIEKFNNVIQSSQHLLHANRTLLEASQGLPDSSVDLLFRNMHTFKGLARVYRLGSLTNRIHEAEERYKAIKSGSPYQVTQLLEDIGDLENRVKTLQRLNEEKLGRKPIDTDRHLLIDKQQIHENLSHLQAIDVNALNGGDRERIRVLREIFSKMVYNPLERVLHHQVEGLREIAISLGKDPPKVIFKDQGLSINRNLHDLLCNVFSHLLRNSVDHGIEKPEVRVKKGKQPAGTLTFVIYAHFDQLKIAFSDDGAGLNLPKILEKAKSLALPAAQKSPLFALDVAYMILAPGFSTAERVTEISGRGVGMDAVRSYIEEHHGTLEIKIDEPESQDIKPVPAQFVISLPGGNFEKMDY